ncbi:MAG TPA: glycosyltransferase [Rubricoccaceae bacterium]|nr:glycosyltransferase [Rubricoccaceae bacterium]
MPAASNALPDPAPAQAERAPALSVLVAARDRPEALAACLASVAAQTFADAEVVVLDDASATPLDVPARAGALPVRRLRSEAPLGATGARNALMRAARGQLFVFLDDDARFETPNALATIADVFAQDPAAALLAFRVTDRTEAGTQPLLPYPRRWLARRPGLDRRAAPAAAFVACGYAQRRDATPDGGRYDERLVYGHEELELAYRVLDAGHTIRYTPEVAVFHDRTQPVATARSGAGGTATRHWKTYFMTRNRLLVAWAHLPLRYLPSHLAIWTALHALDALRHRHLGAFFAGLRDGVRDLAKTKRQPLSPRTVRYLRTHGGRLWY